jgi:hypothetical protein
MLNDGISPKSKHPHSAITNSPEIRSHDSAITKMKTPTFCNHKQPRNSVTRFCNHQNQNTHILQSQTAQKFGHTILQSPKSKHPHSAITNRKVDHTIRPSTKNTIYKQNKSHKTPTEKSKINIHLFLQKIKINDNPYTPKANENPNGQTEITPTKKPVNQHPLASNRSLSLSLSTHKRGKERE